MASLAILSTVKYSSVRIVIMELKRKLATSVSSPKNPPSKKVQTKLTGLLIPPKSENPPYKEKAIEQQPLEDDDYDERVVDKRFYPPVLTNARCNEYLSGERRKPVDELVRALSSTDAFRRRVGRGQTVIHWFRTDLRLDDNTALHRASRLARADLGGDCALVGLFVFSPQDLEAHLVSPARVDFMLRSLEVLKNELQDLNIPLWIDVIKERREIPARVIELADRFGTKHIFANMEYEVDELRRDAKIVRLGEENGIAVNIAHDTCVVPPSELYTKSSNKPFAVYSPWYRAWLTHLRQNGYLLDLHPKPAPNPPSAGDAHSFYESKVPNAPPSKVLNKEDRYLQLSLFPAGSSEAHRRLDAFLTGKSSSYHRDRNTPSKPSTSTLSPYFASGCLSARTAVVAARAINGGCLSGGKEGVDTWIAEVAWRDFYRHVLVGFPWVCMNKPFKLELASISWAAPSLAATRLDAWKTGRTGYPLIDAAMRQLRRQKWMHNRVRMVVASFLAKDLQVDWRLGERFFMESLVDGDFASNNGGWGFASSAGIDPQPYFRIYNPTTQSETWDREGEYIREFVSELKSVKGAEIHNPSSATRKRVGYPERIVEHDEMRKLALKMYQAGIEKSRKAP